MKIKITTTMILPVICSALFVVNALQNIAAGSSCTEGGGSTTAATAANTKMGVKEASQILYLTCASPDLLKEIRSQYSNNQTIISIECKCRVDILWYNAAVAIVQ